MVERLQKILARGGVASRRHAESLILQGRVQVNGQVTRELGSKADSAHDTVTVDGVEVTRATKQVYLMLHKPAGYVTTKSDPEGRPTVYDLLPDIPGLFNVGRLDLETEGLLLLTTDGEWAERVAHPRFAVEREYEAYISGALGDSVLERLRAGIMLDGKLARPVQVREVERKGFGAVLGIVLLEGRHREVRLLCAAAGLRVKRLVRRRVGTLLLGWLALGHWRYLDAREVAAFTPRYGVGTAARRQAADEQQAEMIRRDGKHGHATGGERSERGKGEESGANRH